MDRLLVHQIVSGLSKLGQDEVTLPSEICRLEALIDRLLTIAKEPLSLGQVLWYCVREEVAHPLAVYLLNRIVEQQQNFNFKISSVVNYVHTSACTTPLHLAAAFIQTDSGRQLFALLLSLGGDVLRADVHGLLPLHLAIKQVARASEGPEMAEILGTLVQQMINQESGNSKSNSTIENLFRKWAIVPAAIDVNSVLVLEVLGQTGLVQFSRQLTFEYLEYALQNGLGEEVTGHLLKQLKRSSSDDLQKVSPIGLTLQYNNKRALLQAIDLGFHCPIRLFEDGFLLLRPLMVSEREGEEQFAISKRCIQYLMGQLVEHCSGENLAHPQTHRLLQKLVFQRTIFKTLYRLNESEVIIEGNYLTYALLKHCGFMATTLVNLPLPVHFPVERKVLLPYYRFSRHDESALRSLHRQNRLLSPAMSAAKLVNHFKQNCRPLYDSSLNSGSSADEEYALDKLAFDNFCTWVKEEAKEGPRSLSTLARNAFVSSLSVGDGVCGEEIEKMCQRMAQKCEQLQKYLGKVNFADLLKVQ